MKEQIERIRKVVDAMYDKLNINLQIKGKSDVMNPFDLVKDNFQDIAHQLKKLEELSNG